MGRKLMIKLVAIVVLALSGLAVGTGGMTAAEAATPSCRDLCAILNAQCHRACGPNLSCHPSCDAHYQYCVALCN